MNLAKKMKKLSIKNDDNDYSDMLHEIEQEAFEGVYSKHFEVSLCNNVQVDDGNSVFPLSKTIKFLTSRGFKCEVVNYFKNSGSHKALIVYWL